MCSYGFQWVAMLISTRNWHVSHLVYEMLSLFSQEISS